MEPHLDNLTSQSYTLIDTGVSIEGKEHVSSCVFKNAFQYGVARTICSMDSSNVKGIEPSTLWTRQT